MLGTRVLVFIWQVIGRSGVSRPAGSLTYGEVDVEHFVHALEKANLSDGEIFWDVGIFAVELCVGCLRRAPLSSQEVAPGDLWQRPSASVLAVSPNVAVRPQRITSMNSTLQTHQHSPARARALVCVEAVPTCNSTSDCSIQQERTAQWGRPT
jgi:hypothetical protein